MPTLRPKEIAGLVVIPTVEQGGGVWRVSLGINVGNSRGGPIDVVTREDLVVELSNPSEGDLEAIQSPDPGPLPVRSLRVAQARADFSYGQGVNPAESLSVNLRGASAVFSLADTFPQNAGLTKVPQVGGPFPFRGKRPFLPWLRRRRCCVKRFDAPLNRVPDATAKNEKFDMEADFTTGAKRCHCNCCEYRQFVRGTFTDGNGQAVIFDLPSGPLDASAYREDGRIGEFALTNHGFYGHRAESTPGDEYPGKGGCQYRGTETAGCPPTDTAHLEYVGLVIDRCRRTVAAVETWVVDL